MIAQAAERLGLMGTSLNPWGTVPVEVTIGVLTWASSIFPRRDRGCHDRPLSAKVRKRLGRQKGQVISVTIEIPLSV